MAYDQHIRESAADKIVARCAVVTLSDTRTEETDKSGRRIRDLLADAGHDVAAYRLIPDDPGVLRPLLAALLGDPSVHCILTNGGTGISRRDHTIVVIEEHIDFTLPGFGELFRMLSWEQIGSGAMMSRAVGGVGRGKPIFAMPGSTGAVELAMQRLILPELPHLLHELRK